MLFSVLGIVDYASAGESLDSWRLRLVEWALNHFNWFLRLKGIIHRPRLRTFKRLSLSSNLAKRHSDNQGTH